MLDSEVDGVDPRKDHPQVTPMGQGTLNLTHPWRHSWPFLQLLLSVVLWTYDSPLLQHEATDQSRVLDVGNYQLFEEMSWRPLGVDIIGSM